MINIHDKEEVVLNHNNKYLSHNFKEEVNKLF